MPDGGRRTHDGYDDLMVALKEAGRAVDGFQRLKNLYRKSELKMIPHNSPASR